MGPFRKRRGPLKPKVIGEEDMGAYLRRKVSFAVQPDDRMPRYVLRSTPIASGWWGIPTVDTARSSRRHLSRGSRSPWPMDRSRPFGSMECIGSRPHDFCSWPPIPTLRHSVDPLPYGPKPVRVETSRSEGWLSGQRHLTRNQARAQALRGFESLPFRQRFNPPCIRCYRRG